MGAKTWMVAYSEAAADKVLKSQPQLDRIRARELATQLFPMARIEPDEDGSLMFTCPDNAHIYIGCFPGLSIVAAKEFAIDNPSQISRAFLDVAKGRTVYLHAMHSVVDWFAFAIWEKGSLVRSLSLSPDSGIIEDIGKRLAFEEPFWAGKHPVEGDEYPLPFHPLDLGEEALFTLFGYRLEGPIDDVQIEPDDIPLCGFKRKPWWKPW